MRHRAGTQRNAPLRGRTEALCRSEADRDAEKKQLVHGEGHRRVVNDSDGRWSQKVVVNLGRAESGASWVTHAPCFFGRSFDYSQSWRLMTCLYYFLLLLAPLRVARRVAALLAF